MKMPLLPVYYSTVAEPLPWVLPYTSAKEPHADTSLLAKTCWYTDTATVTTDVHGKYAIDSVTPGTYVIEYGVSAITVLKYNGSALATVGTSGFASTSYSPSLKVINSMQ